MFPVDIPASLPAEDGCPVFRARDLRFVSQPNPYIGRRLAVAGRRPQEGVVFAPGDVQWRLLPAHGRDPGSGDGQGPLVHTVNVPISTLRLCAR